MLFAVVDFQFFFAPLDRTKWARWCYCWQVPWCMVDAFVQTTRTTSRLLLMSLNHGPKRWNHPGWQHLNLIFTNDDFPKLHTSIAPGQNITGCVPERTQVQCPLVAAVELRPPFVLRHELTCFKTHASWALTCCRLIHCCGLALPLLLPLPIPIPSPSAFLSPISTVPLRCVLKIGVRFVPRRGCLFRRPRW